MELKSLIISDSREERLYGISVVKKLISLMERFYDIFKDQEVIECIDRCYEFIEKYNPDKFKK
jgi:hypothetical protein